MATQLIHCPQHLLDSIQLRHSYQVAGDEGFYSIIAEGRQEGIRSICLLWVATTSTTIPWLPEYSMRRVLMLTNGRPVEVDRQPRPLPHADVVRLINSFQDQVSLQAGLSGHDSLELSEILDNARAMSPSSFAMGVPRLPSNQWERRLRIQVRTLAPTVAALAVAYDTAHFGHQERVQSSGLTNPLSRLSFDGPTADMFEIEPAAEAHRHRVVNVQDLAEARRDARNTYDAINHASIGALPHSQLPGRELCVNTLAKVFQNLTRGDHATHSDWRQGNAPSTFGLRPAVPALGVRRAVSDLVDGLDRSLLADAHPLLRAALGAYHFAVINPHVTLNSRAAEVLLMLLLVERDALLPAMPLAVHRGRIGLWAAFDEAVCLRDPAPFIEAVFRIGMDAIQIGDRMLVELAVTQSELMNALLGVGFSADAAGSFINRLLSNHLTLVDGIDRADDCDGSHSKGADELHRLGKLEFIELDDEVSWSASGVRNAMRRM